MLWRIRLSLWECVRVLGGGDVLILNFVENNDDRTSIGWEWTCWYSKYMEWWVSKLDLYVHVAANYYANLHVRCIKSTCRLCIQTWLKDVYRHVRAFGALYMYLQWEEVKGEQHNGPERTVEQKMINSIWNIKWEYTCMTLYIVQVVIFVIKLIRYKWLFIQNCERTIVPCTVPTTGIQLDCFPWLAAWLAA